MALLRYARAPDGGVAASYREQEHVYGGIGGLGGATTLTGFEPVLPP